MKRTSLIAAAFALAAGAAFAQEATPDTWSQAPALKSTGQVRAELMQARKDGTTKAWSAGYIEKLQAAKSREQVRDEALTARRTGELEAIGAEAHAFTPATAPSLTRLVKR